MAVRNATVKNHTFATAVDPRLTSPVGPTKPSGFRVSVGVGMGVAFVLFFVLLAAGVMSRGA